MVAMSYTTFLNRLRAQAQDSEQGDGDTGLAIAPSEPKLKKPPLYKVVLMNDDYTPMEFVVLVLEQFFSMTREQATQVMLAVHTLGRRVGWRSAVHLRARRGCAASIVSRRR